MRNTRLLVSALVLCPAGCGGRTMVADLDLATNSLDASHGDVAVEADPWCADGVRNGSETDVDCGGSCPKCGPGRACSQDSDCENDVCCSGTCLVPFVEVAAGCGHTCATKQDGTVWCWGVNQFGQLGIGTTETHASPVQVTGLGMPAVDITAGCGHTCARTVDGMVWCWGDNRSGQLGGGSVNPQAPSPARVKTLEGGVAMVKAGSDHTCALKQDGTVWCWGRDVGDGATSGEGCIEGACDTTPAEITSLGTTVAEVSSGSYHTCARKQDGTLWCWGDNGCWQLGQGATVQLNIPVPAQVSALGATVAQVGAGRGHTCARKQDGTLWCWGNDEDGQLGNGETPWEWVPAPTQVEALGATVIDISIGLDHSCARIEDGTLWCWGNNWYGQIGTGSMEPVDPLPVEVKAMGTQTVRIATGGAQTCARKQDGSVWCWGGSGHGALGDGTFTGEPCSIMDACKPSPVKVLQCP
jgi:alpha-tubulin suppressor-like RCC1 family protein